jgi:endonuclease-3
MSTTLKTPKAGRLAATRQAAWATYHRLAGAHILETLSALYPDPRPPLAHKDPYTLLVAVVLSARSTDAKVNQVTPELFALADTPQAMALQPPERVQAIIRPCGLSPFKSRSLVGLSQCLLQDHGGRVPCSFEALEALPGVGHKTAGVVMAQAFGQPAFPVDTHIFRMAHRWGLSAAKSVDRVEKDLKAIFDPAHWARLHLQFIYYAREHCPARRCGGLSCQLCKALKALRSQLGLDDHKLLINNASSTP